MYETLVGAPTEPNWAAPEAKTLPLASTRKTVLAINIGSVEFNPPLVNLKKLPVKNSWEVEAAAFTLNISAER